jgi:hypothetical protein
MNQASLIRRLALALLCLAGSAGAEEEGRVARTPPLPEYQQECGACHTAYPSRFLPAASWQRLLGNLGHHFGTDASLDAAATQRLSGWLAAHAGGSGRRGAEAPPGDRITRSAWFIGEHREIDATVWKRSAVKSAANCAACHTGAEKGNFDEHQIRIPG